MVKWNSDELRRSHYDHGRLLMFSGGVESTAALSMITDKDYVITFTSDMKWVPSFAAGQFNRDLPQKILDKYQIKNHEYYHIPNIPTFGEDRGQNDLVTKNARRNNNDIFMPLALLISRQMPQINEIWWGNRSNIYSADQFLYKYGKDHPEFHAAQDRLWWTSTIKQEWADIFEIPWHPDPETHEWQKKVRVVSPVGFKDKRELWESIPDDVKPLVWSCHHRHISGVACGKCDKCVERIRDGIPIG